MANMNDCDWTQLRQVLSSQVDAQLALFVNKIQSQQDEIVALRAQVEELEAQLLDGRCTRCGRPLLHSAAATVKDARPILKRDKAAALKTKMRLDEAESSSPVTKRVAATPANGRVKHDADAKVPSVASAPKASTSLTSSQLMSQLMRDGSEVKHAQPKAHPPAAPQGDITKPVAQSATAMDTAMQDIDHAAASSAAPSHPPVASQSRKRPASPTNISQNDNGMGVAKRSRPHRSPSHVPPSSPSTAAPHAAACHVSAAAATPVHPVTTPAASQRQPSIGAAVPAPTPSAGPQLHLETQSIDPMALDHAPLPLPTTRPMPTTTAASEEPEFRPPSVTPSRPASSHAASVRTPSATSISQTVADLPVAVSSRRSRSNARSPSNPSTSSNASPSSPHPLPAASSTAVARTTTPVEAPSTSDALERLIYDGGSTNEGEGADEGEAEADDDGMNESDGPVGVRVKREVPEVEVENSFSDDAAAHAETFMHLFGDEPTADDAAAGNKHKQQAQAQSAAERQEQQPTAAEDVDMAVNDKAESPAFTPPKPVAQTPAKTSSATSADPIPSPARTSDVEAAAHAHASPRPSATTSAIQQARGPQSPVTATSPQRDSAQAATVRPTTPSPMRAAPAESSAHVAAPTTATTAVLAAPAPAAPAPSIPTPIVDAAVVAPDPASSVDPAIRARAEADVHAGMSYASRSDWSRAIDRFDRAIDSLVGAASSTSMAWESIPISWLKQRSTVLAKLGRSSEAIRDAHGIIHHHPTNHVGYYILSTLMGREKKYGEALTQCREAWKRVPKKKKQPSSTTTASTAVSPASVSKAEKEAESERNKIRERMHQLEQRLHLPLSVLKDEEEDTGPEQGEKHDDDDEMDMDQKTVTDATSRSGASVAKQRQQHLDAERKEVTSDGDEVKSVPSPMRRAVPPAQNGTVSSSAHNAPTAPPTMSSPSKPPSSSHLPPLTVGTYKVSSSQCTPYVLTALRLGYRRIDTAASYGNEESIGKALVQVRGLLRREMVHVTTKLNWNDLTTSDHVYTCIQASCRKLGLGFLDEYLIHFPARAKVPFASSAVHASSRMEAWVAMERAVREGLVRSIGVSNFEIRHLEPLIKRASTSTNQGGGGGIKPATNQIELHPLIYQTQKKLIDYCRQHQISIQAYSPLGSGKSDLLQHAVIMKIARSCSRPAAEVLIQWSRQHGFFPVIRATNPQHLKSNLALTQSPFSSPALASTASASSSSSAAVGRPFTLTDEQMRILDELEHTHGKKRFAWDPSMVP